MSTVAGPLSVGRNVARTVTEKNVTFLAASVSYYAFVSIIPLLLLIIAAGTAIGGAELATAIADQAQTVLTPTGRDLLASALTDASGRGGATVVGSLLLLWSGLKLFRGVDLAFSEVYGTAADNGLPEQIRDALTVLGVIAVAVAAAIVLGGVLPSLATVPFADALSALLLPLVLTAAFLPAYYVFPDVEGMSVREALPGAAVVGVGWSLLTAGFRLYAANAGQFELYGLLGAVLLLVTWFYVAAIVIILGAVLNAVLAGRTEAGREESIEEREARVDEEEDDPAPDIVALEREVEELRSRLDEKTVSRSTLESDLRKYVRKRVRRGHARGWGPYLVLLYGTGMTLGAFYYLRGMWAIMAMFVVWLSTLGLYMMMLFVGTGISALGVSARLAGWLRARRS